MNACSTKAIVFSLAVILVATGSPGLALAETEQDTETLTGGGIDNGFLLAPDFKFTEINGSFANLAGAYGGWLINKKLLVGGGGYTLTHGADDTKMTYGGFVLEYFFQPHRLVNFSVKGLVGGGSATLPGKLGRLPFDDDDDFDFAGIRIGPGGNWPGGNWPGSGPGGIPPGDIGGLINRGRELFSRFPIPGFEENIEESFFIAEPEVNVVLNVTEMFRIGFGGGYRLIGGAGRINDRLDGWTVNANLKLVF